MKKILILILALLMLIPSLASCTYIPTVDPDVITMIVIDADAKVEFMVNPENTVSAATPLNDLAAIIMSGESFTGKKPDEAAADFISLAAKAGLVSEDGLSTVKLSVTGDSDYSEVITKLISKKMIKSMKKAGIKGSVETVAPISEEELLALCLENGYVTEENAAYATYKYLIYSLASQRVSVAEFPSEEASFVFTLFQLLDANVIMKEETLRDVETVKDSFADTYAAYKSAVEAYIACAEEFKAYCISAYLSADSDYQRALSAMRDAREAADSAALESANAALSGADLSIKAEIEKYEKTLDAKKAVVDEIESGFINEIELERHLRATYLERQARVKTVLSTYTEDFKSAYAEELDAISSELAARKQNLMK